MIFVADTSTGTGNRDAQRVVDTRREPVQREYQARYSRHQWKLAALKLAVLIKVGMVMQEHFPRRYVKYVLIGVALLLVARVLVYLHQVRRDPGNRGGKRLSPTPR